MNTINNSFQLREHSVFKEVHPDGAIYIAAKKRWLESPSQNLNWANMQNKNRPLVGKYIKFKGKVLRTQLINNISKVEANLFKSNLIRAHRSLGYEVLNVKEGTGLKLSKENTAKIQRMCRCGYQRTLDYISIYDQLIKNIGQHDSSLKD